MPREGRHIRQEGSSCWRKQSCRVWRSGKEMNAGTFCPAALVAEVDALPLPNHSSSLATQPDVVVTAGCDAPRERLWVTEGASSI